MGFQCRLQREVDVTRYGVSIPFLDLLLQLGQKLNHALVGLFYHLLIDRS